MIVLEVLSRHGLKVMIFDYLRMSYYGRIFHTQIKAERQKKNLLV